MYDCDYAGTQQAFLTGQIKGAAEMEKMWQGLHDKHADFYENLTTGQIIHYHQGFGCWVRCQVVVDRVSVDEGENVLQPIALVGSWRDHDMPRRAEDGEIYLGHYPNMIKDQETFTPNASNLWEAGCKGRTNEDPTTLEPVDLTVPDMTPEQEAIAKAWQKVEALRELFDGDDPNVILESVRKAVA